MTKLDLMRLSNFPRDTQLASHKARTHIQACKGRARAPSPPQGRAAPEQLPAGVGTGLPSQNEGQSATFSSQDTRGGGGGVLHTQALKGAARIHE